MMYTIYTTVKFVNKLIIFLFKMDKWVPPQNNVENIMRKI